MKRQDYLEFVLGCLCIFWLLTSIRGTGPWHVVKTIGGVVVADYWTDEKPVTKARLSPAELEYYRLTNSLSCKPNYTLSTSTPTCLSSERVSTR